MPHISLAFTTSAAVIASLVLAAIGVAVYFYRHTTPPISSGKRLVLICLRAATLSLLLAFMFEPLLRLITTSVQKPVLAVLLDNSKSMTIKDKTGERSAELKSAIAHANLNETGAEITFYAFGNSVRSIGQASTDSMSFDDDATDVSAALRKVKEDRDRLNIGAVLLISDGSYNLGQNPVYEAEQIGIPVYAVGVGDSSEQKDVLITKVVTNDLVYSQTEVPVDVTVKSSGYKGEKVDVVLSEGGRELNRSQITLHEGTQEYGVHLTYTPEGEGVKKYSVSIAQLPGELTGANNRRTFLTRILKSKLHVLILAGGPSPDLSIIRQTLVEDKNLDINVLTQKAGSAFYEHPPNARQFDTSDCIVLIGFPTAATSDAIVDQLKSSIAKNAIPLLFMNGYAVDERKLSPLGSFLPFVAGSASRNEQFVFMEPATPQKNHPILATNTDEGTESWKRLPPVFKTQSVYTSKSEATVLAVTKINNIVLNEPMILIRNVNRQKSLAVLSYGLWRWRLMAQGNPRTENLLATFLSNSIRWLTTREDNRPVKVTPSKPAFTQGEPVDFVGQVYDASADPVDNAQVTVAAVQGGKQFETTLRPLGNGRYEGTLEGLSKGDYTFRASAATEGQSLGTDNGRFSIGELDLEYQDVRMNVQLLRQLAARTGGESYLPSQVSALPGAVKAQATFVQREVKHAREIELWNWQYMLAATVLLLAVEWFLRKRSGML